MLPRDAEIRPDEPHGRNAPKADDDARLQQPELPLEPAEAGVLLLRLRVAVSGRAAFDDIADIAVVPPEVDDRQHVVEQLPGRADEWLAAQVLLLAGAFPDEDDGRGAWSDAEHDAVARGSKAAARAARAGRAQGIELIHGGPPCPDGLPDGARAWRASSRGGD